MDLSDGQGPLYRRLADGLRDAIRRGELGAGSRLPSERDLARSLDISRTTTVAAYRLLRAEGLLESTQGSGTRVTAKGRWVGPAVPPAALPASKLDTAPAPGTVDLSSCVLSGLEVLPDKELRLDAAEIRRLAAGFDYEPLGLPALRAEIAAHYARLGLATSADEVLVTTGAQQAIDLVVGLFGRGGGTIVTENPTYAGALDAARAAGATIIGLPIDDEGIKVRALRDVLDRSAVRLIYLMAAGQNPTGATLSAARRREIVRLAAAAGVPIVDDTALAELAFDGRPRLPLAVDARENGTVVTIGSLSKLFWAGLRIGWIRAPGPLLARLARLKVTADLGSAHLSQLLAIRLLPTIAEAGTRRRRLLTDRIGLFTGLLRTRLPTWKWTDPQGGPVLWVRLPHGSDAQRFAQVALRHGVSVLPGARTSPDDAFADHLRIAYVAEPDRLRTAVDRLSEAWTAYQSTGEGGPVSLEVVV